MSVSETLGRGTDATLTHTTQVNIVRDKQHLPTPMHPDGSSLSQQENELSCTEKNARGQSEETRDRSGYLF